MGHYIYRSMGKKTNRGRKPYPLDEKPCPLRGDSPKGRFISRFILLLASPDSSDILEICVHPDRRRLGIGKGLLEAGLFQARQRMQNSIILEVAEDNLAAQTLYHRAGFKQISRRPNYYLRGTAHIDALVMEKQLSGSSKTSP